ncbi:MAG: antiporter inner membrane protein [Candidatus Methanofastidiosum methylothiophilum]|jgi:Mrp family chromosome partitioning ATPase|uniref:Iron-sulfur cluster carrier protein n=1 Tax=Candidatus Methanofastidiosum methylothiophilum TaxID=1705564 RepID=A0A150J6U5_9EURY|nr:MAG: antiporter inner membrane protein [Candidatus Methanofastidiosum methylthiophilus]NMC77107.1 Mrp/NBP35 family ATP-binding protein [Candidatus Methanofastidiosa archaeon]
MVSNLQEQMKVQKMNIEDRMSKIGKKIAIGSGKGGVGKSVVTSLIASYLAKQGKNVGILDLDITGPSIPMMFGTDEKPIGGSSGIIPVVSASGIKIMSMSLLLPSNEEAVIWRGPMISGAVSQFLADVIWDELDYLLFDLPPGTSDVQLTLMQSIKLDGFIVVTSPQNLAATIVKKAISMAQELNVKILGVVENMAYAKCPSCGKKIDVFGNADVNKIGIETIGQIPIDPEISKLCDEGKIEEYEIDLGGIYNLLEGL